MNYETVRIRAAKKFLAELKHGGYVDQKHSAAVLCTDRPLNDSSLHLLPHHCLQFIDTENPEEQLAFTYRQAMEVRDFLLSLPEYITTLYCCCDWGQSRSAGLAAACMTANGQDCGPIFDNNSYSPNLLVYRFVLEALDCAPTREELNSLAARRRAAASGEGKIGRKFTIHRIVLMGNVLNHNSAAEEWISFLSEALCCDVADFRTLQKSIPHTEDELLNDRSTIGAIRPDELVIIVSESGLMTMIRNDMVTGMRARMRKYILWLKYTIPGLHLMLLEPYVSTTGNHTHTSTWNIDSCYKNLAMELHIPYLRAEYPNNNLSAQHAFAVKIASFIKGSFL